MSSRRLHQDECLLGIVHYLEPLSPEPMKLLSSTKSKITEDKNGENVPHLEITEVVLVHCNVFNNDYQHIFRVFNK